MKFLRSRYISPIFRLLNKDSLIGVDATTKEEVLQSTAKFNFRCRILP